MKTNKELELWQKVNELLEKPLISPKELNQVIEKIGEAIYKKEEQLKERTESRDNWKAKYKSLKEKK